MAIFGAGGCGKTTLGSYLAGQLNLETRPTAYKESIEVEKYTLEGDLVCDLIVPPGQEDREYHWTTLYRDLAGGRSAGVINVVSYGYHSFAQGSYKETKYYKDSMTPAQFMTAYLDNRRERELQIMRDLTPRLTDAKKKIWMITLVMKQDLWWDNRQQVLQHYTQGQYNDYIKQITLKRGENNFAHEYLSASLLISNFRTDGGELLASTTAGYDENIRVANLLKLVERVNGFAGR